MEKQIKTSFIRARIEPDLKKQAESILLQLGLSQTMALTLFYQNIILNNGLPFDLKLPNKETLETFAKTDRGEELTYCKDSADMFDKLGI